MSSVSSKKSRRVRRNRILRSREMNTIHNRSKHTRGRHMKSRHTRSRRARPMTGSRRKTESINMRIEGGTRRQKKGTSQRYARRNANTKRLSTRRKLSFGGDENSKFLPPPYKPIQLVEGATTPQNSAMLAQQNANNEQLRMNNALAGGLEMEGGEDDELPVVQFSGNNGSATNGNTVELTQLLAGSIAAAEGDTVDNNAQN